MIALAGCPPGSFGPQDFCGFTGVPVEPNPGFGGEPQPLRLAGQPLTVKLTLSNACSRQGRVSERVVTDVFDAENRPVAHEATAPSAEQPFEVSSTVSFTPTQAGRYYVRARFEPNLGLSQRFVEVSASRAAVLIDELPFGECDRVQLLASKAVLCFGRTELSVRRAGVEVQRLPFKPQEVVVAANAVWLDDGIAVLRLLDEGQGPLREHAARGPSVAARSAHFATETALFAFDNSRSELLRLEVLDDRLIQTVFPVPPSQQLDPSVQAGLVLPDGLVAVVTGRPSVCLLRLSTVGPPRAQEIRCDALQQSAYFAASGSHFWMQSLFTGQLEAMKVQVSGLTVEPFAAPEGTTALADLDRRGLGMYRFADLKRLMLPRLEEALRAEYVIFPVTIDSPIAAHPGTVSARSGDQQSWLFFTW